MASFILYDKNTWERSEHFSYYMNIIKTRYNLTVEIDITHFLSELQSHQRKFFPSMLFIIMQAVNKHKEFRTSLDADGNPGYWDYVVPSYTIFHEDDHTFSDIWSPFDEDYAVFYEQVISDIKQYRHVKGVKAKADRPDNFIPISSLPWLSFSAYGCDTFSESKMILPIVLFGKYFARDNKVYLPLSISVNHATADGYHSSMLFQEIQSLCDSFSLS